MPYFPNTTRHINTNPRTRAQLTATLARLRQAGITDEIDLDDLMDFKDFLLDFTLRPAIADADMDIGDAIRISSAGHIALAKADSVSTADVDGVAAEAIGSGKTGLYTALGIVEKEDWGLTDGAHYFLSATTAGVLTATAPSSVGQVVIMVGRALGTEQLFVNIGQSTLL